MKKIIFIFIIFLFCSLVFTATPISAKKKIVFKSAGVVRATGFTVSPRLRKDRKALLIDFLNLNQVTSFTYELTYLANGINQGVFGPVTPKGENTTSRELLFGTCSHNVCSYHAGIQDMRFTVIATLKNGQKITKKYRVKP